MQWALWHWAFCVTSDRYDHKYDRTECVSGKFVSEKLLEIGGYATSVTGAAMALAIGHALQAPPLVMYSLCAVGAACNAIGGSGGPLAVFLSQSITCEIGKLVSKGNKIDIIVTPQ